MFQERGGEKEILLGNKQLLGIFFVLAILFCVFFTAGYMVGHTTGGKQTAETATEAKSEPADNAPSTGGETHAVSPDPNPAASSETASSASLKPSPAASAHAVTSAASHLAQPERQSTPQATSPANGELTRSQEEEEPAHTDSGEGVSGHSTYLQVAALNHSDALTVAKVLNKKGFHARISPKAGTPFYRVLVGPVRDAGELNSTRAALKNKGFREVFVQHL